MVRWPILRASTDCTAGRPPPYESETPTSARASESRCESKKCTLRALRLQDAPKRVQETLKRTARDTRGKLAAEASHELKADHNLAARTRPPEQASPQAPLGGRPRRTTRRRRTGTYHRTYHSANQRGRQPVDVLHRSISAGRQDLYRTSPSPCTPRARQRAQPPARGRRVVHHEYSLNVVHVTAQRRPSGIGRQPSRLLDDDGVRANILKAGRLRTVVGCVGRTTAGATSSRRRQTHPDEPHRTVLLARPKAGPGPGEELHSSRRMPRHHHSSDVGAWTKHRSRPQPTSDWSCHY